MLVKYRDIGQEHGRITELQDNLLASDDELERFEALTPDER
ncbi:hypothetical protein [Micromonospora sp. NPDC047738]